MQKEKNYKKLIACDWIILLLFMYWNITWILASSSNPLITVILIIPFLVLCVYQIYYITEFYPSNNDIYSITESYSNNNDPLTKNYYCLIFVELDLTLIYFLGSALFLPMALKGGGWAGAIILSINVLLLPLILFILMVILKVRKLKRK